MDDKEQQRQQDFADHQAEVSGLSNGRIQRFLTGEDAPRNRVARGSASAQSFQTLLDLLLSDAAYASAHARVSKLVDDTQKRLNNMLDRAASRINALSDTLEDMEERAAKLSDGTAVFRDQKGRLRTADGRNLSEAEAASRLNIDDLLSYEQYRSVRDALTSARARQDKLADIQSDIDGARQRLDHPENPPATIDDIDGIEDDLRKANQDMDDLESVALKFNAISDHSPSSLTLDLSDDPSIFAAP